MLPLTNSRSRQRLFRSLFLTAILSAPAFVLAAKEPTPVRVGLTTTDYRPYWQITPAKTEGIVVDILHQIFNSSPYGLSIAPVPRKRMGQAFADGVIDLRIADPHWIARDQDYLVSDVFMELTDVYWSRNIKYLPYPARICAVLGFTYSSEFEQKVADGHFIRVDVTHITQAFQMVAYQRCDLAIADQNLGQHITERDGLATRIKQRNKKDRSWQLRFIAQNNRKGRQLIPFINRRLADIRAREAQVSAQAR